jgi:adenine phosphoribosyltransferase
MMANNPTLRIALLSNSEIKFNALNNIFKTFKNYSITRLEGKDKTDQIEQPISWNGGYGAARNRFMVLYKENPRFFYDYELIVIMENYMEFDGTDHVAIIFFDVFYELEFCLNHPCAHIKDSDKYFALFMQEVYQNQTHKWGSPVTFGSLLHKQDNSIPANDWMSVIMGKPRQVALEEGLIKMMDIYIDSIRMKEELINEGFTSHNDFPKPGVVFKDWSNIFLNPDLLHNLINMTTRIFDHRNMFYKTKDRFLSYQDYDYDDHILNDDHNENDNDDNDDNDDDKKVKKFSHQIDYVVGLDSRGLWLAPLLAMHLDCGMIPARKPGKIPGKILSETYQKEYGTDTIEIRNDVPPGNVLIVDDILATGGSLMAAIRLVERAGHKVIGCAVVSDVPELREVAKETLGSYPVHVLLKEK